MAYFRRISVAVAVIAAAAMSASCEIFIKSFVYSTGRR